MQGRIGKICMDRENLESGIWKRILEVWNLDIGIPDLSAKTVAAHFWIGKICMDKENLESGIWKKNLEPGIWRLKSRI